MKKTLMCRPTHTILIYIAILLLPFVNSVGVDGGNGKSISIFPIILGVIVWGISFLFKGRFVCPKIIGVKLYTVFIVLTVVSFLVNITDIIYLRSSGSLGFYKFIQREVTTILYLFISIYIYTYLRDFGIGKLRVFDNIIIYSFYISLAYSVLEIIHIMKPEYTYILAAVDSLFRGQDYVYFKVRSLTFEASTLGMYLCIVFPILLTNLSNKKRYYVLLIGLCIMALLSLSRTVYVILIIQFFLYLFLYKVTVKKILGYGIPFALIVCGLFLVLFENTWLNDIDYGTVITSLYDAEDSARASSNAMRYGSQVGALNIFFDNIFWGVGLGQTSFYLLDYVPDWIWEGKSMEYFQYNMVVFGVYFRLLSDVGIIGTIVWISVWISVIVPLYRTKKNKNYNYKLVIIIIGLLLNGLNWDSLSYPAYWLMLGVAWYVLDIEKEKYDDTGGY